jgi:hypothetical protein
MDKIAIKEKIIAYINAAYQWHEEGSGSIDEGVGEKMCDLEEKILTSFGLPFMAQQYSDILQAEGFSNENIEERVKKIIETLQYEAEKFLLAPIEKDTKILVEAKRLLQDAVEVLPIIGITATGYNCFLYYDIFLKGIYSEDELLQILKKVEILDNELETRVPHTYDAFINEFSGLNKMDLPFLNDYGNFLKYKESKHNWDEGGNNDDIGDYLGFPDVFELTHFIITHIYLKDENTCCITILKNLGKETLVELTLWCTADLMRIVMLHAKYYSLAIPPLYVTGPKFLNAGKVNIQVRQAIGKNIEIENIKVQIKRLDNENDKVKNPFDYVIISIEPKETIPEIYFEQDENNLPF